MGRVANALKNVGLVDLNKELSDLKGTLEVKDADLIKMGVELRASKAQVFELSKAVEIAKEDRDGATKRMLEIGKQYDHTSTLLSAVKEELSQERTA